MTGGKKLTQSKSGIFNWFKRAKRNRLSDESHNPRPVAKVAYSAPIPPGSVQPSIIGAPEGSAEEVDVTKAPVEIVVSSVEPTEHSGSDPPDKTEDVTPTVAVEEIDVPPRSQSPASDLKDRERTKARYEEATRKLEEALKSPRANWKPIKIPEFNDVLESDPIPKLQEELNEALDVRKMDSTKGYIERGFTAISPLAKNVLFVAQSVNLFVNSSDTLSCLYQIHTASSLEDFCL
jgi:hypothetical protein